MSRRVVVIGGGLAGLSAAYTLAADRTVEVVVLEASDRLGGRAMTQVVDGIPLELGGVMVLPWYTHFTALLKELGLDGDLQLAYNVGQFYEEPDGSYRFYKRTPLRRLFHPYLAARLAPALLSGKLNFYNPSMKLGGRASAAEYVDQTVGPNSDTARVIDMLLASYTYGALADSPVGLGLGFVPALFTNHGFDRSRFLRHGVEQGVVKLASEISAGRGQLLLESPVTNVHGERGAIEVEYAQGDSLQADAVVYTNGLAGNLLEEAIGELGLPWAGGDRYTNHVVAIIELDNPPVINGVSDWAILYRDAPIVNGPSVVAVGNYSSVTNQSSKNLVDVIVRIHPRDQSVPDRGEVETNIAATLSQILDSTAGMKFVAYQHWPGTMPIAAGSTIQAVRAAQGMRARFYAGDYTGLPTMETAVFSGRRAARAVIAQLGA